MSAHIIVNFTVLDSTELQSYGAQVGATLAPYSGTMLAKGETALLHGEASDPMCALLQFPSAQLARDWFDSPAYQALAATRDAGMRAQFRLLG
jgi:uncharacterized protein (DUF1330 family)